MSDTGTAVKEIREVVRRNGEYDPARMAALAVEYSRACQRVSDKAEQCRDLLRKGLRTQAVGLARKAPDLRDEFKEVDFPGQVAWLDICESRGLDVPPLLETDAIAATIDEVYMESENLEQLVKSHRRMAIGRAPLADRLRNLRAICRHDPDNENWKQDIHKYELARQEELAATAEQAGAREDLAAMRALLAEARSDQWLHPPTRKFIAGLEQLIAPHARREAAIEYRRLADELSRAHRAMDEALCRELMGRLREIRAQTRAEPSQELAGMMEAVGSWLDEQEAMHNEDAAFGDACSALQRGLDSDATVVELEKLSAAVLAFERGMPETLAASVTSRIEGHRRKARRKFVLRLSGVVAAAVLVLAGATFTTLRYVNHRALERWRTQVAGCLDRQDLPAAEGALDCMSRECPGVYASPDIQALRSRLAAMEQTEKDRKASFEGLISQLKAANGKMPEATALVEQASGLARTDAEKATVQTWRDQVQSNLATVLEKNERDFMAKVQTLQADYLRLQNLPPGSEAELDKLAMSCVDAGRRLMDLASQQKISEALTGKVTAVIEGADAIMKAAQTRTTQDKEVALALERLAGSCTSVTALAAELEKFRRQFPDNPISQDYAQSLKQVPLWKAQEGLAALTGPWLGDLRVSDSKTAADRLAAMESCVKTSGESLPETQQAACDKYVDYLLGPGGASGGRRNQGRVRARGHPGQHPHIGPVDRPDQERQEVLCHRSQEDRSQVRHPRRRRQTGHRADVFRLSHPGRGPCRGRQKKGRYDLPIRLGRTAGAPALAPEGLCHPGQEPARRGSRRPSPRIGRRSICAWRRRCRNRRTAIRSCRESCSSCCWRRPPHAPPSPRMRSTRISWARCGG